MLAQTLALLRMSPKKKTSNWMPPGAAQAAQGRCRLLLPWTPRPRRASLCVRLGWAWCHNAMREQSCAPHALTRCAPALPFAQELKLWDGDVTLELGHLGLPAGAHLQCRTVCSLRDVAWLRARTTTVKTKAYSWSQVTVQNAPCFELGSCLQPSRLRETAVSQRYRALGMNVTPAFTVDLAIHAASRRLSSTFNRTWWSSTLSLRRHSVSVRTVPPPTVQQLPLFDASDLIVSFVAHARSALVHIAHSAALFRFEAMAKDTYN